MNATGPTDEPGRPEEREWQEMSLAIIEMYANITGL